MIGGEISADAVLRTAVADHNAIFHDSGCSRDRVVLREFCCTHAPDERPRFRVERLKASIEGCGVDSSLVVGDATIHDITARVARFPRRHFGVMAPKLAPRLRIDGKDDTPGGCRIEHAINHERGRFETPMRLSVVGPGETEVRDGIAVDLL